MKMLQKKLLLFVFLQVVLTGLLYAQNDTVTLKEIRISSVANPVRLKEIPRQITILSQNEIKKIPAQSVGDILQQAVGVDIRQRGVYGMQADLSINGGSFDQALVLINGIPVNDPQTGHHNLDQVLSLNDITKVEIVRGPSSRWFGPGAFSGAVNIITKNNAGNHLSVDLHAGQYGLFSSSFFAGYAVGKTKNQTSVSGSRSNGYRINTDFKNLSVMHQTFFNIGSSAFNLQLGYAGKAFGANSFYTALFPDQYEKVKVMNAALGVSGGKKLKYSGNVRWRRLYDRFELFREGAGWYQKQGDWYVMGTDTAGFHTPAGFFPYTGPNFHRTDVAGVQGNIGFQSALGKTAVGLSWEYEKILSNVLGVPMHDTIYSDFDKGAFYDRQKDRQEYNLFLNQLYQKENFSISAGINIFYNAGYGMILSPGFDFSWFTSRNVKVFLSANRAIRLPTFTDLYYRGPDHLSNPDLKPEKVDGFSGGVESFLNEITLSASVSYRLGYDIIDWVKKDAASKWESKNLTRMNTFGVGFSADYRPHENKDHFIRHLRLSYQYLYSSKKAEGYISLYALDYLRHDLNLFVQHKIYGNFSAGWTFSVRKRNGYYFDYTHHEKKPYKTVFLVNTRINYSLPHFNFYVQIHNLLNQTYRDVGSVVMPGFWITGGVRYRLPFNKRK